MIRIEPFLLEDESLLGSFGTGRGVVCATDRRLLRVERSPFGRQIRDLSYREVSSVAIVDRVSWRLVALGALGLALGAALPSGAGLLLPLMNAGRGLRLTLAGSQIVLAAALVLMALGVAAIVLGLLRRRCEVALDGPFLLRDRRHRGYWRFPTPTPSDARVFAGLVRARLVSLQLADEKKVLPHDPV